MFVYRWEMMRELLELHKNHDGDPHEALLIEYVDPTNGQPVLKTITFLVQMLQPGQKTLPVKSDVQSCLYRRSRARACVSSTSEFDWEPLRYAGGTRRIVVPIRERIFQGSADPIRRVSDEPTLKTLALYQKHGKTYDEVATIFD